MMWWLIIAAPAALVAYELLDEDRRAVWVKRWAEFNAHTCEFGEHCGRLRCRGPRRAGYRARESVDPRTVRIPSSPTAVTPPRPPAALDTSELHGLLADAKQGLDRRNGGSGLRSGGKIGLSGRRALTEDVDLGAPAVIEPTPQTPKAPESSPPRPDFTGNPQQRKGSDAHRQ